MNKVILIGRLTRDPDYRQTQNGEAYARFSLAVDRKVKRDGNQQQADFPSCVAFGKTADFVEKYFKQGSRIALEGRLQTGSYEKNGMTVYTTDVIIENVEFCESKKDNKPVTAETDFMAVNDEGLPFN